MNSPIDLPHLDISAQLINYVTLIAKRTFTENEDALMG